MRLWPIVGLVISCGSGRSADSTLVIDEPKPVVEPDAGPAATAAAAKPLVTSSLTIEEACVRFQTLASQGCAWTQRFPPAFRDASCAQSLEAWANDPKLKKSLDCWTLECAAAEQCMGTAEQ